MMDHNHKLYKNELVGSKSIYFASGKAQSKKLYNGFLVLKSQLILKANQTAQSNIACF